LRGLHDRLRRALPADAELIFVDDGSDDGSTELLADIVSEDSLSVALRFQRSFGKSQALVAGFARCHGRLVATIDADLQDLPEEIECLAAYLRRDEDSSWPADDPERPGHFDLVCGWRHRRQDRFTKVLGSQLFNTLVRWVSGVPVRDVNCGLKVMRREVVEAIRVEEGFHRFLPLLAHWKGFRIGEVEVEHAPRLHGRSRFGRVRIVRGLIDLLVLIFLERFERRPSRFFIQGGGLLSLSGIGLSLFISYLKLTTGTIQSRYPLLVLGVLLTIVGVQLISLGFVAELVSRQKAGTGNVSGAGEPLAFEVRPRAAEAALPGDQEPSVVETNNRTVQEGSGERGSVG
jgi:glycosyltransferase involved in cell wall biosynthesis